MTRALLRITALIIVAASAIGHAQDRVPLTVWTIQDLDPSIYQGFIDLHPHIDLNLEYYTRDDLRTFLGTALAAGEGPDVFSYTPGPGFGGAFAHAGLLRPLDDWFETLGWGERFYAWTYERETYDGQIFGIGDEPEMIGVFYHRDVFEDLGLEVPTTYAEFLEVGRAVQAAGYIPIAFANAAGWPAYHTFSMFANNIAGVEVLDEILFDGGSWDRPEIVEAVRLPFVEMAQAGFFVPGTNAVSYDEGNALFFGKVAAMHLTGMWILDEIFANVETPETVGFFAFPAIEEGGYVLPPAGIGTSYYVAANTAQPDAAATFLDYLFSYEVGLTRANIHFMLPPFPLVLSELDLPALAVDTYDQVQQASTDVGTAGMGYNIDVLTPPRFNRVMADGFQGVIDGRISPEEQVRAMQQIWAEETQND